MARLIAMEDNEKFPRINTRVTKEALIRLNYACALREKAEPRTCPQGTILTELIIAYLDPVPDAGRATVDSPEPRNKGPKSTGARRGRPPKAKALTA